MNYRYLTKLNRSRYRSILVLKFSLRSRRYLISAVQQLHFLLISPLQRVRPYFITSYFFFLRNESQQFKWTGKKVSSVQIRIQNEHLLQVQIWIHNLGAKEIFFLSYFVPILQQFNICTINFILLAGKPQPAPFPAGSNHAQAQGKRQIRKINLVKT